MIIIKYLVTASVRFPSDEARNKDFRELNSDIESAANIFNTTNTNKSINSIQTFRNMFQFIFTTESEPRSIGHDLSSFSRSLYRTFNWARLSREPNKLLQYNSEQITEDTETSANQLTLKLDTVSKTIYISKELINDGYNIKFL